MTNNSPTLFIPTHKTFTLFIYLFIFPEMDQKLLPLVSSFFWNLHLHQHKGHPDEAPLPKIKPNKKSHNILNVLHIPSPIQMTPFTIQIISCCLFFGRKCSIPFLSADWAERERPSQGSKRQRQYQTHCCINLMITLHTFVYSD